MKNEEKKLEKLLAFAEDSGLAIYDELQDINELLADVKNLNLKDIEVLQGEQGERGEKPTEEEIIALLKPLIPKPEKGEAGRNPLTVSKVAPKNPQKGDLWYKN